MSDVERRLAALEAEAAALRPRERELRELAEATERLTSSTTGLDSRLTTVGRAMEAAKEAKATAAAANVKADDSIVQLARSEHRYRRHTRRMAAGAVVISLLATGLASGGVLYLQRHTADQFHHFLDVAEQRCEQRQHDYDEPNHLSVGADVTELKSELRQARANRAATESLIRTFPRRQRAALRAEVRASHRALRNDLAVKEKAFAAGVIGSCHNLK